MSGNGVAPLPHGWARTNLGAVVEVLDRFRVPVNAEERARRFGDIPYYGATGQVGWIDDYLFDEELVLLGEDGAPFLELAKPKAYMVRGKSWVNNHAHVLRALSPILNAFLMHQLNQADFRRFVSGTTRLKLPQGSMTAVPLVIAPAPEQHRIVAEIEKHFTRLDASVAALKRARANLKRYRTAVLQAACEGRLVPTEAEVARAEGREYEPADVLLESILKQRRTKRGEITAPDTSGLPDLPEGWTWAIMPQLGELNRGKSKHRPRNDPSLLSGPFPFIQTGDVKHSGGMIRHHSQTYSEFGLAQSRLWPKGTLCITIAANIAETGILAYPACFPDSVVGFVFHGEGATIRFIELFLRTAKEELSRFAPATAQKNINLETLSQLAVPLPPLPEQQRIVAEVDRRLSLVDELEGVVEHSLKRADRLRQSILKRAFEGKLVPQDPNDEPASALLERIRAGRDAQAHASNSRRQPRASSKQRIRKTAGSLPSVKPEPQHERE